MPVTEVVHHPLVATSAQDRELYHKQYTMNGLQELQAINYKDPSVSASGAYFTIKPPLGNTLIDRNILVELSVTVTAPAGGFIGARFCPKSMPANRMIETCNVKVNSQAILSEPSKYVSVLSQFKTNQEFIKKYRSLSPTEPDTFNRYENYDLATCIAAVAPGGAAGLGARPAIPGNMALITAACPHNPQSPFRQSSQSTEDYEPRGAFPCTYTYDAPATKNVTSVTYTFTEPLLNPFCMPRENSAVAHVTDLSVQLNFGTNLDRAFSGILLNSYQPYIGGVDADGHAIPPIVASNGTAILNNQPALAGVTYRAQAGETAGALTYTINSARLLVKVATASIPLSIKQDVNYNEFMMSTQNIGPNDGSASSPFSGGLTSVSFNTVRLPCIPSHVYLFARQQVSGQTRYNADAFLSIQNISITCMNKTGILSGMSQQQLYNISAENGVNMSWAQWSQKVGSILCLNFGKDVVQLLPGVRETLDISFNITLKDTTHIDNSGRYIPYVYPDGGNLNNATNDTTIKWEMCMLSVFPATLTVSEGMAIKQQGISPAEAQDAVDQGPSMETLEEANQAIGGGFSDWMNRNSHKAWTGVKKYAGPVAQAANALAAANPSLAPLAAGANMVSAAMGSGSHRRTRGGGLLLN